MIETPGVDYSTARPSPALLLASGFRFAMRYVSPLQHTGPNPKDVSAAELQALRAVGLGVGLVFESTSGRALAGPAGGAADGQLAAARAIHVGYPRGCVLFGTVDFAPTPVQLPAVTAYAQGFARAVKVAGYAAGMYAGRTVVDHFTDVGGAGDYWWQAAGWGGGATSPHAHLLQRVVKHWANVPGTDEDVLCRPLPLAGWATLPAPTTGSDSVALCSLIRNDDTGDMALIAPGFFFHVPAVPYLALYVAAGLIPGPAPAWHGSAAQYEHLRAVVESGEASQLSQLQAIADVDARILAAVGVAHPTPATS